MKKEQREYLTKMNTEQLKNIKEEEFGFTPCCAVCFNQIPRELWAEYLKEKQINWNNKEQKEKFCKCNSIMGAEIKSLEALSNEELLEELSKRIKSGKIKASETYQKWLKEAQNE